MSQRHSLQVNNNKKLQQREITFYFQNNVKCVPRNNKKRIRGSRIKYNETVTSSAICNEEMEENTIITKYSRPARPDFSRVEKRKLLVEIFSDDEDDRVNNKTVNNNTASNNDDSSTNLSSPLKRMKIIKSETTQERIETHLCTSTPIKERNGVQNCNYTKICNTHEQLNVSFDGSSSSSKSLLLENYLNKSKSLIENKEEIKNQENAPASKANFNNLVLFKALTKKIFRTNHLKCLLSQEESRQLLKLFQMEKRYQFVCIRLFTWKRKWYNIFKFIKSIKVDMTYDEIMDLFNCFKNNEFVDTNYMKYDLVQLLNSMGKKEVKELCQCFRIKGVNNKQVMIEKLLKNCNTQPTLTQTKTTDQILRDRIREKMGYCVKFAEKIYDCLYKVYILGTFTNSHYNDLQEFFRTDLNIVYPSYKVESYPIFQTAEEFSLFFKARMCRNEFERSFETKNYTKMLELSKSAFEQLQELNDTGLNISRPRYLERFSAAAQYVSLLSTATKHLLTTSHYNAQLWLEYLITQHYHKHKCGFWYCQLALIQMKYLHDYEAAAKTIISAFKNEKDFLSEVHLHELSNRGNVLQRSRRYKISQLYHDEIVSLAPSSCDQELPSITLNVQAVKSTDPGKKRLYLQYQEDGSRTYMTVEEAAIQHYQTKGYSNGIHCESSLISATCTLLFWDLIYDHYVEGAFISDIQSVPLDMYTKYFYINREEAIDKRLDDIRSNWNREQLVEFIRNIYNQHSHKTALVQINKVLHSPKYLINIIECINRNILCEIFRRLLRNFSQYSSGFPDLFVWNIETKKCKFVEVKSDNDRLSVKQKLWLNYLLSIGCEVEVCHVHSIGTKKKSKLDAGESS